MSRLVFAAGDTFRSLRTRNFRLFFVGQLVSQAGTWIQSVAVSWVVLQMTGDGVALGGATAAQFLPVLILGAWGGVVSDRVDRHRFLLVTQSAFLVVASAFAALTFTGLLNLPLIYLLSATFGIITALDNPARRALVVDMVSQRDVPNAVGLNSALMTGSRVVGPAIGGVLLTTAGAGWAFAANAVTYLAVIAAVASMERSALRTPPRVVRARGQLREGLRHVWASTELRLSMILMAVIGTFSFEWLVTLPLLAERTFDGNASTYTLLFSAMSSGSLIGALIVARRTDTDAAFLARAAIGLSVATAALTVAPTRWLAFVAIVPVGYFSVFILSGSNSVIQLKADPAMRGRVLALTAVVFLGSTPIGGPIAGAISEHLGARAGVGIGAIASGLVGVWTLRQLKQVGGHEERQPEPAGTPPSLPAASPYAAQTS